MARTRYARSALTPANRYLGGRSGGRIDGLALPVALWAGPLALSVGSCAASGAVAGVSTLAFGVLLGFGVVVFFAFLAIGIPLEQRGHRKMNDAQRCRVAGHADQAVLLSQRTLRFLFRRDIRMRAYHELGLVAESRAEFAEAAELFELAEKPFAAFLDGHPAGRAARAMVRAHRAIALVGARRLDEAEACLRSAWDDLGATQRPPTFAFANGAAPVWLSTLDGAPRDPRTLVAVASIVVLAARGRAAEAADLDRREAYFLSRATEAERALLDTARAVASHRAGGGPHRSLAVAAESPWSPWAARLFGVG